MQELGEECLKTDNRLGVEANALGRELVCEAYAKRLAGTAVEKDFGLWSNLSRKSKGLVLAHKLLFKTFNTILIPEIRNSLSWTIADLFLVEFAVHLLSGFAEDYGNGTRGAAELLGYLSGFQTVFG